MKLVLYCWNSNNEEILYKQLLLQGHEVTKFTQKCNHYTRDFDLAQNLIMLVNKAKIEGIVSFNFFPIISMIAQATGIKYYSWVYDSPHLTLYSKQTSASCNRIGIFDKKLVNKFETLGVSSIFHLRLPVSTEVFEKAINNASEENIKTHSNDISFVGSLYNDNHNYFNILNVSEETKEKTRSLISENLFNYKKSYKDIIWPEALKRVWIDALINEGLTLDEDYTECSDEIFEECLVGHMMTHLERSLLLERIAEKYGPSRFSLYTNSNTRTSQVLQACNRGIVGYNTQMPIVFNNSKINLNLSLKSIESGIPLRVLDIMACGGFVISNYQKEIEEYFEIDKEIVVYYSLEECLDKIDYYLSHEKERETIAQNGFLAVANRFSYNTLIPQLFE